MGKLLNVRVTAQTYNEDDVAKTWPHLASMVWPQWYSKLGLKEINKNLPGYSIGFSPVEKSWGARKHGVVELAEALPDLVGLSDLSEEARAALEEPVKQLDNISRALSKALADWDAKKAHTLTSELEDALNETEQALRKLS